MNDFFKLAYEIYVYEVLVIAMFLLFIFFVTILVTAFVKFMYYSIRKHFYLRRKIAKECKKERRDYNIRKTITKRRATVEFNKDFRR